MKNFIKGRWFPLIAAIVVVAVVAFIMALFGWRITYAPELETSWECVSAVGTWAGVITSFIAIMVAVQIPSKIADRQDKIALFEKRYTCYVTIQNLLLCAKQMENATVAKEVQAAFRVYMDEPDRLSSNIIAAVFAVKLKQKQTIIASGYFLFSHYNVTLLHRIIDVGVDLILNTAANSKKSDNVPLSTQAEQLKTKYCQLCKQYSDTYIKLMEKELQLNTYK